MRLLRRSSKAGQRNKDDETVQGMSAESEPRKRKHKISAFGREFALPRSRALRIAIGVAFLFGGVLWFLPVLGLWMLPVGFLVLSYEFAMIRRHRRRFVVWWERRRRT